MAHTLATLPDNELMRMALDDQQPFTILHDRHRPEVLQYVSSIVHDPDLAEEVTEEVLFQVYEHRHDFKPDQPFIKWLITIARNKARDALRRRKHLLEHFVPFSTLEQGGDNHMLEVPDPRPLQDQMLEDQELWTEFERAAHALPDRHRKVFQLFDRDQLTHPQISEVLGIPLGTSRSHLHHARAQARPILITILQ